MAWLEAPISDGAMAFLMPSTSRAAGRAPSCEGGAKSLLERLAGVVCVLAAINQHRGAGTWEHDTYRSCAVSRRGRARARGVAIRCRKAAGIQNV